MTGAVDWDLAVRVGGRIAPRGPSQAELADLAGHLDELTSVAEGLVAAETGLVSLAGPARARVVDRPGWVAANVRGFRRLLKPLVDKLDEQLDARRALLPRSVLGQVAGAEVGLLLGLLSGRVLGQYELLVLEEEELDDQDVVSYVGPNLLALEQRHDLPPAQFRLWIALHEVTHRAQFTAVPWMRAHFLSLVEEVVASAEPDPANLLAGLRESTRAVRSGERRLDDHGLAGLLASPEQRAALERMGGLMSVLEGHGERTMDRAGAELVPDAGRFHEVLRARRASAPPLVRFVQRLVGLEAKLNQYAQGERFLTAVEAAAGSEGVALLWEAPERLPTLAEVRDPASWLARVGLAPVAA